ncbi:MAG: DUF4097 domain-containing protein [Deinococcota bacterium]|jgi:hypothetical protein|nr:DUF4097 domain-containing protein [Deinococcota bacterium]
MFTALSGAEVKDTVEVGLEPRPFVALSVTTGSGSIAVQPPKEGAFHITARVTVRAPTQEQAMSVMNALRQDPPVVDGGEEVVVGDLRKYGLSGLSGVTLSIDFDVETPRETALKLKSGSGSQHISAIRGPVQAQAGSGEVVIGEIARGVEVTSGSGAITVRRALSAEARAGSGAISLQDIEGPAAARTGSGRIFVVAAGGDLLAHSSSGGIRVDSALPAGAAWRLEAASGSIEVRLG